MAAKKSGKQGMNTMGKGVPGNASWGSKKSAPKKSK